MGNPVIYTLPSLYLAKIMTTIFPKHPIFPKNTQYFMILESQVLNFNSCRVETLMANIEFYHIRGLYSGLRIFIPTYRTCMIEFNAGNICNAQAQLARPR